MVARGAGTAGPVLLACRQWDPLGLARRLPSPGVGAWRSVPVLPWRVQCPVRLCAALGAGSGGSGRYLVLCLSRFPLPAPRVPRCVWRAVPSGCPLPSLAGTPFPAVCAFRELGPVALLVVLASPLRVCALVLPRRPLPPPLGGVASAPRAVPALSAGRAVPRGPCPSACPAPVPCSVWRAWGGWSGPGSPLLGLGLWGWRKAVPGGGAFHCCKGRLGSGAPPPPTACPLRGLLGSATHVLWARACGCGGPALSPWPARPVAAACRGGGGGPSPYLTWGCAPPVGRVPGVSAPGGGLGGGGRAARAPCPPFVRLGGACRTGGSLCLVPSLCLPWAGNKAGVTDVLLSMAGVAPHTTPVRARPPSLGAICAASWRVGAGSLVPHGSCGSRWLGRGGGPRSGSSLGRRRGDHPPCLGGWGPGPLRLAGRWGGRGGSRAAAPLPPLWVAARGSLPWPLSCRPRTPPRRARAVGVPGPPQGGGG